MNTKYCNSCRAERGLIRKLKVLNCKTCGDEFRTTSGNLECHSCLYKARKKACACGELIHPKAEQCMTCFGKAHRGENSSSWKGGRVTRTYHGYVLLRMPDHPRGKLQAGYVREHIAVMEEHLGRYLLPIESVHHKNGIRDDNRIENLELWTRYQPSGHRAEDALAHAREIISLYGTDAEKEAVSAAASDLHVTRVLSAS